MPRTGYVRADPTYPRAHPHYYLGIQLLLTRITYSYQYNTSTLLPTLIITYLYYYLLSSLCYLFSHYSLTQEYQIT